MAWIELTAPLVIGGVKRPKGTRIDYPDTAASALVANGRAFWTPMGPRKQEPSESEETETKEEKEVIQSPDPADSEIEAETEEPAPADDDGFPTLDEFKELSRKRMAETMRRAGLAEEADLRKSDQMTIVYGAWLSERD